MNEIQVGDRRFEVIGYDDVGKHNLTHALLCESTLVDADYVIDDYYDRGNDLEWVEFTMPDGYKDTLFLRNLKYYDILLLNEIVSGPIEFVGEVISTFGGSDRMLRGVPAGLKVGMKFKCVEVRD